jgi:hypothetical protein
MDQLIQFSLLVREQGSLTPAPWAETHAVDAFPAKGWWGPG